MNIERGLLYARTIRYLKPIQVYGQLKKILHTPKIDLAPPPPVRKPSGIWVSPIQKEPSITGRWSFRFLNLDGEVNSPSDWNSASADKLWLYNLHYFDDLTSKGADNRSRLHYDLIEKWINENPPGAGNGWEPYPISLRVVNWIKWTFSGNTPPMGFLESLAVQARFLQSRLEYHLLGNHLFENARALIFAGLFFEGREADGWLDEGLSILEKEIKEQILSDGGHFERSPMYHSIVLEGIIDLMNLFRLFPGTSSRSARIEEACHGAVRPMCLWLKAMTHPDGRIALFNDSALSMAASFEEIERYAAALGINGFMEAGRVAHLKESGYIRLQMGEAVAILDVGEIGPDYIPGHGHADVLSFELSLHGKRFIVDTGTSCYGVGTERLRQRSTPAHNTVSVDGADSSEVWAGFRVARRARPFGLFISEGIDALTVKCSHDGFRRLKGQPVHTREWILTENDLMVRDTITGHFLVAEAFFHMHPSIGLGNGTAAMPWGGVVRWSAKGVKWAVEPSTYHPEFGAVIPSWRLRMGFLGADAEILFKWGRE